MTIALNVSSDFYDYYLASWLSAWLLLVVYLIAKIMTVS